VVQRLAPGLTPSTSQKKKTKVLPLPSSGTKGHSIPQVTGLVTSWSCIFLPGVDLRTFKGLGAVTQVVEHLPSKREALSSNCSTAKNINK
jgi:hypothetical protein